jgi:hypothetical protein
MTEAEWLANTSSAPMLGFLQGKASSRKLRFFAVACCRRIWHLMKYENSRQAVDVAERFADGIASEEERESARRSANIQKTSGLGGTTTYPASRGAYACTSSKPLQAAFEASFYAVSAGNLKRENEQQVQLILCIFGNPFRPVTFDPSWLTSTVIALAHQMYESRDFSAMPILADALQDAGSSNDSILEHCRGSGPHVRGCWVVDLCLSRE